MSTRRRRGGSLVLPIVLITLGFLFLLDNLGALPDNAWNTVWQLWPVIIIAIGLEILLGRRVSFGALFVLVLLVVIVGAVVWGSVFLSDVEMVQRTVRWPREGIESAEIDIDVGIGELHLSTQEDMSELLYANLEIPEDAKVEEDLNIGKNGRAEGQLQTRWDAFFALFSPGDWQVSLHPGVRLEELRVNSGIGDVEHSAEPSCDALPTMLLLRYGDPRFIEYNLRSARTVRERFLGLNQRGFLQFKSSEFGSEGINLHHYCHALHGVPPVAGS